MTDANGIGPLRRAIEAAAQVEGLPLKHLTVLARQNDPFLQDTPAGHRDGQWFAEHVARFVHQPIHLRGLHYRLVAAANVLKPDGSPYTNTDEDWIWLQNKPAKTGRWLGYVPFGRIVDERNAEPEVTVFDHVDGKPYTRVSGGHCDIEIPSEHLVLPSVYCSPLAARQPYRIIQVGEKTSLGPVLRQIRGVAELLLPTGEISDTLIHGMAERAAADGRPAVVFYFSDFDPSGWQMPISVSRKLQALKLLEFPDLSIEVHHVALTLEQVVALDLPSTPLKDTERRGDLWREVMGREQTEIDALAALRSEILLQIARDAIAPFRDATLERRAAEAHFEWTRQAEDALRDHPDYDSTCQTILSALTEVEEAVGRLRAAQEQAQRDLTIMLPPVGTIEPEARGAETTPLFDTRDDFASASRRLINHKRLNGGVP
jgi:hypothetical protein